MTQNDAVTGDAVKSDADKNASEIQKVCSKVFQCYLTELADLLQIKSQKCLEVNVVCDIMSIMTFLAVEIFNSAFTVIVDADKKLDRDMLIAKAVNTFKNALLGQYETRFKPVIN